MLLKALEK
jgi:NAD(P)-dependent dehydrogenase (short-subunit alcohol dehydrogenase family)/predicted pyridoxine 5'-phosphate oxidase superfamily flavin-nucleotide-binding protein